MILSKAALSRVLNIALNPAYAIWLITSSSDSEVKQYTHGVLIFDYFNLFFYV